MMDETQQPTHQLAVIEGTRGKKDIPLSGRCSCSCQAKFPSYGEFAAHLIECGAEFYDAHLKKHATRCAISKLSAEVVGMNRLVHVRVQPVSIRRGVLYPAKYWASCSICNSSSEVLAPDLCDFISGTVERANTRCPHCKKPSLKQSVSGWRDVIEISCTDLPQDQETDLNSRRHITIILENKAPLVIGGVLEVVGHVLPVPARVRGHSRGMAILAEFVRSASDCFDSFAPTPEDEEAFKKHFAAGSFDELMRQSDGTFAPYIRGRGLFKAMSDIALHSKLKNYDDIITATLLGVGDSRVGKSETIKDAIAALCPPGSEYLSAESASRTGVSYYIDTSGPEPVLRFGALATADRMAVGMDALNAWGEEQLSQVREVISQKIVDVRRCVSGKAYARTRILAAMNTPRPVKEYPTRYQAAMSALGSIDRNRYDFVVVFGDNDVPKDEIDHAEEKRADRRAGSVERTIPAEVYRRHLMYCWQDHPHEWAEGVSEYLTERYAEIRNVRLKGLSILSNEFAKKARNWTVAIAQRCHSFEGGRLIVRREHVDIFAALVNAWLDDLEVGLELRLQKAWNSDNVGHLVARVSESPTAKSTLCYIAKHSPIKRADVAKALRHDRSTITRSCQDLEGWGLIEPSDKPGVKGDVLTELGAKVVRELLKNGGWENHATN